MKNITLSAEEGLIERAREYAKANHTTLNAAFRVWLEEYTSAEGKVERYDGLTEHLHSNGPYARDDMNER